MSLSVAQDYLHRPKPGEEHGDDKDHRDRGRDEIWKSLLERSCLARDPRAIAMHEPRAHLHSREAFFDNPVNSSA